MIVFWCLFEKKNADICTLGRFWNEWRNVARYCNVLYISSLEENQMKESSNLPIPISFFWYPRILHLYITIYISISYTIFRKGYILKLYNWNWKTGRFWLLCSLTFLYQAIECPEEFVAYGHSVAHHVEALSCLYRLEVRANSRATH